MGAKMHLPPYAFARDYLLRTNVMTAERLAREYPPSWRNIARKCFPRPREPLGKFVTYVDSLTFVSVNFTFCQRKRGGCHAQAARAASQTARRRSHRAPDLEAAGNGRFYRDILGLPLVHCHHRQGMGAREGGAMPTSSTSSSTAVTRAGLHSSITSAPGSRRSWWCRRATWRWPTTPPGASIGR